MSGYDTIGSATVGDIASTANTGPAPSGTVTTQAGDGGQGQRFVLTTANATSGSVLFDGTGVTADFGPIDFEIASNAADFTVPRIPAGSYNPVPTLIGPGGTSTATGAQPFTINGVSGGGVIGEEPVTPPVVGGAVVGGGGAPVREIRAYAAQFDRIERTPKAKPKAKPPEPPKKKRWQDYLPQ